ncbi:MAG: hypothetical protein SNI46_00980 [Rikenellaceae bacterium]
MLSPTKRTCGTSICSFIRCGFSFSGSFRPRIPPGAGLGRLALFPAELNGLGWNGFGPAIALSS